MQNGFVTVQVEDIIVTFHIGKLFGENVFQHEGKKTRALSGMTKTDCVLLILNEEAFSRLVKVRKRTPFLTFRRQRLTKRKKN